MWWCHFPLWSLCILLRGDDTCKELIEESCRAEMFGSRCDLPIGCLPRFFSVNLVLQAIFNQGFSIFKCETACKPRVTTCTLIMCMHTRIHTHTQCITELMSDLPHVDSVIGCGLEHSNRTSGQVRWHKDPLVVVCPSLWAPGTFACHVLLCDNKSLMSSSSTIIPWLFVFNVNQWSHLFDPLSAIVGNSRMFDPFLCSPSHPAASLTSVCGQTQSESESRFSERTHVQFKVKAESAILWIWLN